MCTAHQHAETHPINALCLCSEHPYAYAHAGQSPMQCTVRMCSHAATNIYWSLADQNKPEKDAATAPHDVTNDNGQPAELVCHSPENSGHASNEPCKSVYGCCCCACAQCCSIELPWADLPRTLVQRWFVGASSKLMSTVAGQLLQLQKMDNKQH